MKAGTPSDPQTPYRPAAGYDLRPIAGSERERLCRLCGLPLFRSAAKYDFPHGLAQLLPALRSRSGAIRRRPATE
jgi:hypothetical protein